MFYSCEQEARGESSISAHLIPNATASGALGDPASARPSPRPELSPNTVAAYLGARGLLPEGSPVRAQSLSGGISNIVLRVDWDGGAVVVKQSLPMLRVDAPWPFDPRRVLTECDCLQALGDLLPTGAVPRVLDVDADLLALTMTCAPDGGTVWKDALLRGDVDLEVARRSGVLLATVHRKSAPDGAMRERFADLMPMVEGRIEPYHRTAAAAHPDLAPLIARDVERLTTQRRALVLGDFSPKNLLVYADYVLALDFEVAHWGDPAFDTAFLMAHLVGKSVHLADRADLYLAAARAFWAAYRDAAGPAGAGAADTATELAVLLLCRVDGKSRLEYLDAAGRERLRSLAPQLLAAPPAHPDALLDAVAEAL